MTSGWPVAAASQNDERNRGLSPELGRDGRAIGGAGYLRFFSVARRKSTSRSSDWRMKRFSFCSNSGSRAPLAMDARRRVLERLDRQVDLAVFLDGDDLGLTPSR